MTSYDWYSPPGYEHGLKREGYEIVAWETFGDWQGDYGVVVKKDGLLGFVVIGYGSCSGCDAMEACESQEEYEDLLARVISSISWGTRDSIKAKIKNEYDDNNWYRSDLGYQESVDTLIKAVDNAH